MEDNGQNPYEYIKQANAKVIAQFDEIKKLKGLIAYFIPLAKWYCHTYPDKKASIKILEAELIVGSSEERGVDVNIDNYKD